MKRIWYFGTDGGSEHYSKCISSSMTSDEYSRLCDADSDSFEKIVCVDYGGYIVYGIPYSVNDVGLLLTHTCLYKV